MVRMARESDLPRVAEMGKAFFAASGLGDIAELDEAAFAVTIKRFVQGDLPGALLVAEDNGGHVVGMAAFVVFPFYFNHAVSVGQEIFWWVEPAHRSGAGRDLLTAMEQEARASGASLFIMASLAGQRDEALTRIYTRRGFRALENTFIRTL